ncbi:MAG: hypothetical protein ACP5C3_06200 [Methanomicrobiales archaeon]
MDKKSVLIACMLVVVFILGGYDLIMALATSQEQAFEQLSYDANSTNNSYANNNSIGTNDVSQSSKTTPTTTTTRNRTPASDTSSDGTDGGTDEGNDGGSSDGSDDGNSADPVDV